MEDDSGQQVATGWSKYPTRVVLEEKTRVGGDKLEKVTQQLQAVCEVHAATSNALSATEEHNVRLRMEVEELRGQIEHLHDQNAKLCADNTQQAHHADALKDKCLDAHEKLGTLAEYQVERGELLRQSRDQSAAIRQLKRENADMRRNDEALRSAFDAQAADADQYRRQAEAQLRCNEVVTEECNRLKRVMAKGGEKRSRRELDITRLQAEVRELEEKLRKTEKALQSRERLAEDCEEEGKRLKRERVQALRSLQDEQDRAKERELWLRTLRRENTELRERLAAVANEADKKESETIVSEGGKVCGGPAIPVVEVGERQVGKPAPDNLLTNLKLQNKMQMRSLTNTLQQLMHTVDRREVQGIQRSPFP